MLGYRITQKSARIWKVRLRMCLDTWWLFLCYFEKLSTLKSCWNLQGYSLQAESPDLPTPCCSWVLPTEWNMNTLCPQVRPVYPMLVFSQNWIIVRDVCTKECTCQMKSANSCGFPSTLFFHKINRMQINAKNTNPK